MTSAGADWLEDLRGLAFGVAYRMLGSVADAEDIAQETVLRVHNVVDGGERLESPRAYATTVATRLSIDLLRSARVQRERYHGEWLPEPLVADLESDPAGSVEMADSLSMAFLVLLETLSPEQRAAFLLHDVFEYGYDEVAAIVGTSEANARQLAARARRHLRERRPRYDAPPERREELASRFLAAALEGDVDGLEALLAEDVVLHGDGGGKVPALARSLSGREKVARVLVHWATLGRQTPGVSVRPVVVNGQPGFMALDGEGRLVNVMALEFSGDLISEVHSIVNPDKLQHLGPVGDMRALLASFMGERRG